MAKRISTAGGNAQWTEGETFKARLVGERYIKVDGEDRRLLEFKGADGKTFERWSLYAFDEPIFQGILKFGDVVEVACHPMRGKGKKQYRPFDISLLEGSEITAAGF